MKKLQTLRRDHALRLVPAISLAAILAVTACLLAARGREPITLNDLSGDRAALDAFALEGALVTSVAYLSDTLEYFTIENGTLTTRTNWADYVWRREDTIGLGYAEPVDFTLPVTGANGKTAMRTFDLPSARFFTQPNPGDGLSSLCKIEVYDEDVRPEPFSRLKGIANSTTTYSDARAVVVTSLQIEPALGTNPDYDTDQFPFHWESLRSGSFVVLDGVCYLSPILTGQNAQMTVAGRAPLLRVDALAVTSEETNACGTITEIAGYDTLNGRRRLDTLTTVGGDLLLVTLRDGAYLDLYRVSPSGQARGELSLPYSGSMTPVVTQSADDGRTILHISGQKPDSEAGWLYEVLAPDAGGLTLERGLSLDQLCYPILRHGDRLLVLAYQQTPLYGQSGQEFGEHTSYGNFYYPLPSISAVSGLTLTVLDLSGDGAPQPVYQGVLELPAAADSVQRYYAPYPTNETQYMNEYAEGGVYLHQLHEKGATT